MIEAAGDGPDGSIVELRRFEDASGRNQIALAVRSDLGLDQQIAAEGATWLDRRLVARQPADLSYAGFGAEVRAAFDQRIAVLARRGLARRDGDKVMFGRNLIETLRRGELEKVGRRRRNHWEKTSHSLLVGAILHVLYAEGDKTLAGVANFLS